MFRVKKMSRYKKNQIKHGMYYSGHGILANYFFFNDISKKMM
jgi:hypothetical protein